MNCEIAKNKLSLFLYGELSFHEEEMLEQHLESCEDCRLQLEKERSLHQMFAEEAVEPSLPLLSECRGSLRAGIAPKPQAERSWLPWLPRFNYLKPLAAVALVALGFFSARLSSIPANTPVATKVRYVETGEQGKVRLVVDETRERVISGRLDDASIRGLLLTAAKDPSDAGLRADSLDLLKSRTESEDVRRALIYALQHDNNAAVRLKALDALRSYAGEGEVRRALSQTLLKDDNAGMRAQAIDLLLGIKNADVIGVLQEAMNREDDSYVRQRCQRVLLDMKASPETF